METSDHIPLLTFGYGRRSGDDALALLKKHRVAFVVDVRSVPWSRHHPEFSQDRLQALLASQGIRYVFMGEDLGGRPDDASCYDDDGRVDYEACRRRPAFARGIGRLLAAWTQRNRVAIMCSESRPEDCHRTKLIADALISAGAEVAHLDEHGIVRTQEEVVDRLRANQMTLLAGNPEALHKSRGRYRATV